jgi:hypothetical protein
MQINWMVIIRLGSALTRAQDDPVFQFSLSYSAVIIYLIQYVVCQEKYRANWQFTSHLLQIQISPFFYEKNGINRIKKASTVGPQKIVKEKSGIRIHRIGSKNQNRKKENVQNHQQEI